MRRLISLLLFGFLCSISPGREFVHVHITYPEGEGPQGDYLIVSDEENRFSLKPISSEIDVPAVRSDEIVSSVLKIFPNLAGKVSTSALATKPEDLIRAGNVFVFGQVKSAGTYAAETLGNCVAKAGPTEFGMVRRITVIRGSKRSIYDIGQKIYSDIKLQPGDLVLVPMKMIYGN